MREDLNDVRDFLLKVSAKMGKKRKIKEWLQETLDNFFPVADTSSVCALSSCPCEIVHHKKIEYDNLIS